MTAIFNSLITQLNSSVFTLLALLVLFIIGVWIVASKVGAWKEKFFHHDKRLCEVESISGKVTELKVKVDLIYQIVNPNATVKSHSPLSLTPIGEKIANKIGAQKIFDRNISKLVKEVELGKPKNAYDIQELSMNVAKNGMLTFLNEQELNLIKQEAYTQGSLIEDIMAIFGILLRNYILKEKGLPISDVDKYEKQS